MRDVVENLLREENIFSHTNQHILIIPVQSSHKGVDLTKAMLYTLVDKKTMLFLSGGKTPKELYQQLAHEEKLIPGTVGMIDERYGEKMHESSNEKMITDTGFLRYLQMRDIPFKAILRHSEAKPKNLERSFANAEDDAEETAEAYDQTIRTLFATFPRSIALLGIGADGHTAGLPSGISNFKFQISNFFGTDFFTSYDDKGGKYGKRVTITFTGLSMLDLYIVLVFGKEKRGALQELFADGSEEEIPARFYKRPDIAKKTIIITDQM